MKIIENRFQINENRILIYIVSEGYAKPTYTISEGFIKDGVVIKDYYLSQWDDYGFNAEIGCGDETRKISFEFDINHPLYIPLFHLLNYDDELIIDDDDTIEDNKKFIIIRREKDKIIIDFINELQYDNQIGHGIHIFIKNILRDGRSKIDLYQKDTKERLCTFFREAHCALTDYHQISIEECLLRSTPFEEWDRIERVFKRKI